MRSPLVLTLVATLAIATVGAASAQSPSPSVPTADAPSPSAAPAIVGPVFPGTVVQAIPPLVNGTAVTVIGPTTVDATAEDLSLSTDIVSVLRAVAATQIETAVGHNDQLIIMALRIPGADSVALDGALLEALKANPAYSGVRVMPIAGRAVHAFNSLVGTQYAWVNGDILFWVYGPDGVGEQAVGAMPGSSVPLVPGGPAPAVTTVDLTIGAGPDAGTYHGVAETGACSKDPFGSDQYGLQYSTTDPAIAFSSLQVIIDKGEAATGKKGSNDFSASATLNGNSYDLDPADGGGKGTAWVTLGPSGDIKAVYQIKGKTKDKTPFEATVSCAMLIDFGG